MRLLHLADLHLGKMLCGVSLLENGDQGYWVKRLLELIEEKRPDAVLVAGDVYDRGLPPGGATELLSEVAPKAGDTFSGSGFADGEYVYTVKKDNNIQKASDLGANFSSNKFTAVTANASGAAVLLGKGAYNVEAYKVKNVNGKITLEFLGAKTFTVTDNQTGLTWTKTDKAEKISALTNDGIKEAFEVKFGDEKVTDVTFNFTNDGTTAYVKTVSYTVVNGNGLGTRTITATVDTLVKKG